ncbi:MAG: hypothetical protein L7F78_24055, partial [Syntrophales bacterium LBB04]|nr:hypothetical protein [Syntrophales bacterium LBB04]
EVDLLLEGPAGSLLPVDIKYTRAPVNVMGKGIRRFRSVFKELNIEKGLVVTLAWKNVELSKEVSAVALEDYLKTIDVRVSGLPTQAVL